MTIRFFAAAVLLASLAGTARAQGWGGEGSDPNRPGKPKAEAAAAKPAPAEAKEAKPAEAKKEKPAAAPAVNELADTELDRSRGVIDRQFSARKTRLNQRTAKLAGYHIAMEKDSIEAERQMAEERKAFLLYLKSVPQEDRANAMANFEDRQEKKRADLDKRHLSQYKAWYEEHIHDTWRTKALAVEKVAAEPVAAAPAAAPAAPAQAAESVEGEETAAAPAKPAASVARAKVKKRAKR
jgi:hypothetical protein